jgi:ATP-dependent Clp protease ATP-binding subunit ClpC
MIIFHQEVKDVITYSKEEALRLGHDFIGTEHLMLGILRWKSNSNFKQS